MKRPASEIAVLSYHKIGTSPGSWESWYYVPQPVLEAHVRTLIDQGWEAVGARQLVAGLRGTASLPARGFLITFDDAYRSLTTGALPWLIAEELPAVVFVPTDYIGRLNEFDRDVEPEEPICGWDDLRQLSDAGVSIQSHAASHRAFSTLTIDEQAAEIRDSRMAIEEKLGIVVDLLAYPYGDAGRRPAALAARLRSAGYQAAFGYGGGVVQLGADDPFLLPRIAVGADTDIGAELRVG